MVTHLKSLMQRLHWILVHYGGLFKDDFGPEWAGSQFPAGIYTLCAISVRPFHFIYIGALSYLIY
jgi:hypothetical protein